MKNFGFVIVLLALGLGLTGCPSPQSSDPQSPKNEGGSQVLTFGPKQTGTQPITLHDRPITPSAGASTIDGFAFGTKATWPINCVVTPVDSTATITELEIKLIAFGPVTTSTSSRTFISFSILNANPSGSTFILRNPQPSYPPSTNPPTKPTGFIVIPFDVSIEASQSSERTNCRCVIDIQVTATDSNGKKYVTEMVANTANLIFR